MDTPVLGLNTDAQTGVAHARPAGVPVIPAMAPKPCMQLLSRAPPGPASMLKADTPTNDALNAPEQQPCAKEA
eukprot:1153681-Pelagomonas_calceolata.AAC.1